MIDFPEGASSFSDPEQLANEYLRLYYKGQQISYPVNPFKMLLDEGISFAIRNFGHLEGVYIPAENSADTAIAGINLNRPITRQRFTAAHELCHHFRDSDQQNCPMSGKKTKVEWYAERFAAALLMPSKELELHIRKRSINGYFEFDDVLEIADYFGVSFEACLLRVAYTFKAIAGDTKHKELKKRMRNYKPEIRRKERGLNNLNLYESLIDSYTHALRLKPNDFMRNVFQNDYIYNDSRMEGVHTDIETAAEIVSDIRLNKQKSKYCSNNNEVFLSIAGHAAMYTEIFASPTQENYSVFEILSLNRKLFSYFPHPEYGGQFRQSNVLVLGAKFETIDYHNILPELMKIDCEFKDFYKNREKHPISAYIKYVVKLHHKLTIIHPFSDGNGRTLRAVLNMLLVRNNITPVYIKAEDKDEYFSALRDADLTANYVPLYEFFFRKILKANVELTR